MSLVSLVKFNSKSMMLQQSIEKTLELINFEIDPNVNTIAIKPNLCYYWDATTGETTDPRFVDALIDVLRKKTHDNVGIAVVESDASAMRCENVFLMLGYKELAEKKKIRLVNLTHDAVQSRTVIINGKTLRVLLPNTVTQADLFVSIPKIKYMGAVKFSGALKNTFGCNAYPKKYRYHKNLNEAIVGLNKLMKPDICLLDGLVVRGIVPRRLNLVMACTDPVAFDSVACKMAGINPRSLRQITLANAEGIGQPKYVCVGDKLNDFTRLFPKKNARYKTWEVISKVYSRLTAKLG
jgi:uncharacterized protein (DUF362 family)